MKNRPQAVVPVAREMGKKARSLSWYTFGLISTAVTLAAEGRMIEFYIDSKSGDYLEFYCSKHDEKCHLEYKGWDPSVPFVELTCPTCKEPKRFKLDRPFTSGLEPKKQGRTRGRT